MQKKKGLAAVVTLYNPTDEDIKNIDTYIDDVDKLYIIDNTEGESNIDRIPSNKKIDYRFKNENVGVATALNIGAEEALKDGYKYLLTMDQDTSFNSDTLKVLKADLENIDMSKIAILTPWHSTKLKIDKPVKKYDLPDDVMTSANILNLDIWKEIGGFKDWLFIDGVDIEYCLNVISHGYYILRNNSVEVEHNLGDLFYKKIGHRTFLCTNHSAIRRYYIMRNYHYILDMYKEFNPAYCYSLVSQKHNMIGVLLFERKKIKKIKMYIRGYKDYKNGIKGKYIGD